jgi:hypothetical protein
MGHILQRVKLSADKTATVQRLVDTGATFSVIPEALARTLGVKRLRRSVAITLADGRPVKLDAATAIFRIGEREAPATIASIDSGPARRAYFSRRSSYGEMNGWPVMVGTSASLGPTPISPACSMIGANIARSYMSCWILCRSASRRLVSISPA